MTYARTLVGSTSTISDQYPIIFYSRDLEDIEYPHDDPLVIEATIANYTVKRVLIDGGSSADLLFYPAFCSLGFRLDRCQPSSVFLLGFSGNQVPVLGILPLHVRIGNGDQAIETLVNFHVVECSSAYNGILGRHFLHQAHAIPSTLHLKLKLPTPSGVGCVRGDQAIAKQCCAFSLKHKHVTTVDTREEVARPVPVDLDEEQVVQDGLTIRVSTAWPKEALPQLLKLVREFKELLAQGPEDMPGLDRRVAEHALGILPGCLPVQQKRSVTSHFG
ncbi:unnamed protein product [Linum trigynum]|uniref:Uncharacterized protein n=1 Tax=Linum trigynum TaxID=586398 RepID=A0AAV2CUP5_9ROSI